MSFKTTNWLFEFYNIFLIFAEQLTVSRFTVNLREILRQPSGQLGELVGLIEENWSWIYNNRRDVGDALTESDVNLMNSFV